MMDPPGQLRVPGPPAGNAAVAVRLPERPERFQEIVPRAFARTRRSQDDLGQSRGILPSQLFKPRAPVRTKRAGPEIVTLAKDPSGKPGIFGPAFGDLAVAVFATVRREQLEHPLPFPVPGLRAAPLPRPFDPRVLEPPAAVFGKQAGAELVTLARHPGSQPGIGGPVARNFGVALGPPEGGQGVAHPVPPDIAGATQFVAARPTEAQAFQALSPRRRELSRSKLTAQVHDPAGQLRIVGPAARDLDMAELSSEIQELSQAIIPHPPMCYRDQVLPTIGARP